MDLAVPALAELATYDRWVCWRWEERDGRRTKPPLRPDGRYARNNDRNTWSSLKQCQEAAAVRRSRIDGVGFILGDGICGIDLDNAIEPETGAIRPWAREVLSEIRSYAEISPSGAGVKILLRCDPEPVLSGHVLTIAQHEGDKDEQIEIYTSGRYFCITGRHLEDTPDTLEDGTVAFERLAFRIAGAQRRPAPEGGRPAGRSPPTAQLPASFQALLRGDDEIRACWERGTKLGRGGDTSASGIEFSLLVRLARVLDDDDLSIVLGNFAFGQLANFRGQRRERRLARLLETAAEIRQRAARPQIFLRAGALHGTVSEAERALAHWGGIYQRGSVLVRVARVKDPILSGPVRRPADSLVIVPVDPEIAVLDLTAAAIWWKLDRRSGEWVVTNAPRNVACGLLASSGRWSHLPALMMVMESPTITTDGRLINQSGLDLATGILVDVGSTVFPKVPDQPTKRDALAALAKLRAVIREFPFEDEAAESVVLAAMLTPFVRPSLRSAPLFAFNAHKMGSGKTLLATIVSYLATGRAPAMISQADDPESEKKRLLAVLMEGSPVTVIDNIEKPLKSDAMASILTEPLFKDRVLGLSRTATVPTATTWIATGNNLLVAGDLSTRVLVATLDPAIERPEERRFAVDLHTLVPERRGELVAAALTIMLAYHVAGRPVTHLPIYGRFETWSAWCREPLVWLGLADPCATRRKVEARDPTRDHLAGLLRAWHDLFGMSGQTVASAIKTGEFQSFDDPERAHRYEALRDVVIAIADERGRIDSRRLGNFISRHERRWEGGLRFVKDGNSGHAVRWAIERSGELGEFREFPGGPRGEVSDRHTTNTWGDGPATPETHLTHPGPGNGSIRSTPRWPS